MASFGYKRLGRANKAIIEKCLGERGVSLPRLWHTVGIDDRLILTKMALFFEPPAVASRLRTKIEDLVAGTMRIRFRDLLFLHGFVRNSATARFAIVEVLTLAQLDMTPTPEDVSSQSWVYMQLRASSTRSVTGPVLIQPVDDWSCDRADAENAAERRRCERYPAGWVLDEQRELTVRFLEGRHTFGILPTGSGKSLCFELTAEILKRHGVTVVVSPLIALMADRTKRDSPGITFFNSTLTREQAEERCEGLRKGTFFHVYVTPERLGSERFVRTLIQGKKPVIRVAIDEAHCVSLWGQSFRPEYLLIRDVLRRLGSPPVLLLTATAPPDVRWDVARQLGLDLNDDDIVHTFYQRGELIPGVQHVGGTAGKYRALVDFIRKRLREDGDARGIVYTQFATAGEDDDSCENCREIAQVIGAKLKVRVAVYHGQLPPAEKAEQQERFTSGDARILAATNAFGLGIDLPDINWIAHFYMPPSLLDYYQEIGRGGRRGRPCSCLLLYDPNDRAVAERRVYGNLASPKTIERRFRQLIEGAKGHTGLRGPHEVLYDRREQVLFLPFRPLQFTVRLGHLLVLQEIGIIERIPANAYHAGAAYARFRVHRESLTDRDWRRLEEWQERRRSTLAQRICDMEEFCQQASDEDRWRRLWDVFGK
jgi:RecQ family ATP-dependent DNA helicase